MLPEQIVSGNDYKRIREVVMKNNYEDSIGNILCNLLRYMKEKNWIGACHATSAALYVALTEAGYSVDLCAGEVEFSRFVFDHSWIELDNKIIDLAVSMTLMGGGMSVSEPIVLDTNIATGDRGNLIYGSKNGRGLDAEANFVTTIPFCEYMNNFPDERNGLWGVVEKLLERQVDIGMLKDKYKNTQWQFR